MRNLCQGLREGLRELGYVEGQNYALEYRSADENTDRLPGLATELVRQPVDMIVATFTPCALAAKQATTTIPIVLAVVADPVGTGLVASLARPGGNITGFSNLAAERGPENSSNCCGICCHNCVVWQFSPIPWMHSRRRFWSRFISQVVRPESKSRPSAMCPGA